MARQHTSQFPKYVTVTVTNQSTVERSVTQSSGHMSLDNLCMADWKDLTTCIDTMAGEKNPFETKNLASNLAARFFHHLASNLALSVWQKFTCVLSHRDLIQWKKISTMS